MRFPFATLIATLLIIGPALAADPDLRTIATTGEATVYVVPDEVVVNLGVETFEPLLEKAKNNNDEASARLVKALKGMGIEEKHIQTDFMALEIRYRAYDKPNMGIEGFIARRTYTVTLKKIKEFEDLIDVALTNGANRLLGFEYRNTELRKHRDEARKMAIRAAREKAALLAGELECKVGAPRSITEAPTGYYGYYNRNWGNAYMAQNAVQHVGDAAVGGETMPIGQISIRASVTASFDLVPAK